MQAQANQSDSDESETKLETLPTTESGAVRKSDAVEWMQNLDESDEESLKQSVVPKPNNHTGSTMPEPITRVRIDGDPEFVEEFAKFLDLFLDFESINTRVSINLQQVEDRDSGELQDDVYALYLSVAERA